MSESIVRKVQPFTIGTRLSVPAVPKCPDFTQSYLQHQTLDNCTALQHNLNDHMSLYLSHSQVCAEGLVSPLARRATPVKRQQEDMAAEDHLNQNVVSHSTVSRSIKKITISGSREDSGESVAVVGTARLPIRVSKSENNNNNNNITTTAAPSNPQLPRIVGVSCENKPSSHFKVLLRKDSNDEQQQQQQQQQQPIPAQTRLQWNREKSIQQISVPRARSPKREPQKRESQANTQHDGPTAAASQSDCFTQRNSLFNKEMLQAEAWIQGKLQDLKDGCNVQRCPLQDWEEASQTLHRDLKDFENTLIQLNQMGEQLISKLNPTSDLVKRQLTQLRDQWQTLKQTAANQSRALGGAKSLQEFNKKVDKLEAWIKEKEEQQSLVSVLGENIDKMQLTRRILDLKQDEQLYRNLHEEINHLALKLEKQGKTDSKNISSRRKHINKMWLKVQSHLKKYHENLQLALEVSSFYQQADNTLFAINNMRKSISASKDLLAYGDREIRDIASQIMMLDVTVSQLSNLHPALAACVTQKHSELKDCWTLLQKAFRTDRPALPPAGSTFTREDADPLTPAREQQCSVGTEPHRIMGKEVKEEQNRLKGCVSVRDCESSRRLLSSQSSQEQQSAASRTPPIPLGDGPAHLDDVMGRHESQGESRRERTEPKPAPASPRGHPQLHAQLQKFTVSADKTLSWLKDNVAMATQVCSMAGVEGPEAARRCQEALEQEILTNRVRIEVVKKEGRGLVRAQHPGSAKIEQFLAQLEVLWEELRRRHQRNAVFLQASEQLGFRAVRVLQALGSLEAWLESVELSLRESSLAGDPETMSMAERESCLLQREVSARGLELSALKQEVERLSGQSHPHTQRLPARMEEVERKYQRVQSALTQQSSELQDTRMLTEFLERVELEESQDLSGSHYSLGQPLHSDISSAPALLGLQGSGGSVALMESMGDPVEELREAVEMLNDTVRERGRAQNHDQAIQELISKHASLAVRVEECFCRCKELSLDILERETDMAVKCEPDRCGLEGLQERHDHLEIDYEAMKEQVKEMESRASRLQELCPERVHILGAKVQASLQAWRELGRSVVENRGRLREFVQLQDFFRSYLAMISWTEDTRACIFSEAALHFGKDGREPLAAELDMQIEQKFEEFDELAAAGRKLLNTEHHLAEMVRERMEELRSMLGWILVHWRAQKRQWLLKMKREKPSQENIYSEEPSQENICSEEPSQENVCSEEPSHENIYSEEPSQENIYSEEPSQENIYSEASVCSPLTESSAPEPQSPQSHQAPACVSVCEDHQHRVAADSLSPAPVSSRQDEEQEEEEEERSEDGYEVMTSIEPRGGEVAPSEKSPFLVLKEPGAPALGGTVNLILSFGNTGDSHVQVLEPPPRMEEEVEETSEPVHRDQSMSLLSVHMGLDGAGQRGMTSGSVEDMEEQGRRMTTGGRCNTVSGRPELQSMEGTLERKHKLQLGGKKASCRAWSSHHAVLYRQTLCFYQDRKDTLRSSLCGLPLNLTGAECVPSPEYTKKTNCFSLRLRDGSEYLLSAASRFMMKKWMLKIQANTGHSESVPSMSSGSVIQEHPAALTSPSPCPSCHGLARCHCSSLHDVTSTFPRRKPTASTRGKEIVVLTRDCSQMPQGHLSRLEEQTPTSSSDTGGCDGDFDVLRQTLAQRLSGGTRDIRPLSPRSSASGGQDWLSNKRRSHSFTSATYQRIKPLTRQPPAGGGPEVGSSYSVTLVIGDKPSDSPSITRNTEPPLLSMAGWQQDTYHQDTALRSYASLPRPRNKSVFKKFFGKKQ